MSQSLTTKDLFSQVSIQKRFEKILGNKAQGFISSVLQISNSDLLSDADPMSVLNAAATAAALDLPINPNLGLAYIVAYNTKQKDGSYKKMAQFQMGYKGLIQLSQRSGLFKTINVTTIKEGEITNINRITGEIDFVWIDPKVREDMKTVGYAAYFELSNGFSKMLYMSLEECNAHGAKYSKTFKNKYGLWATNFDHMASKTVLKLLLSRYAPLSIELQTATLADQSIQRKEGEYEYPDNDSTVIDITEQNSRIEKQRIMNVVSKAKDVKQLQLIETELTREGRDTPENLKIVEEAKAVLINAEMEAQ